MVDFDSLFPSLQPPDFKEGDDITNPNVKLEDFEVQNNYYYSAPINLGGGGWYNTTTHNS